MTKRENVKPVPEITTIVVCFSAYVLWWAILQKILTPLAFAGVTVSFFPSQFSPRGKNGERMGRPILSPGKKLTGQFFPPRKDLTSQFFPHPVSFPPM